MNKKLGLLLLVIISLGIQVQAQDAKLEVHAKAAIKSLQHKDFSSWKQLYPDKDVMMEIIGRMGDEFRWTNVDPSLKPLLEESYYLKAQSKLLRQFVAYFSSTATTEGDGGQPVNWSAMQYQRIQVRKERDEETDTIMEKYEGWILLKDDIRHKEWVLRFDDVIRYKNRFYGMDIDEPRLLDNISFDDYVKEEEEGSGRQPEAIAVADSAAAVYADTAAAVAVPGITAPREAANYAGTLGTQKITLHWEVFSDIDGSNYSYCSYWLPRQQGSFHFDKVLELGNGNYLLIREGNGGILHLHKTATAITGTWVSPDGSNQRKISLKKIAG